MRRSWKSIAKYVDDFMTPWAPPVDLERLAQTLSVTAIEPRRMKFEGYLGRLSDGRMVIRFREASPRVRQRFTVAHEIGHILLARIEGTEIATPVRRDQRDNDEERIVNRIAARILIPEFHLRQSLPRFPKPTWQSICRMAGEYQVSQTAMIRRLRESALLFAVEVRIPISPHNKSPQPRIQGSDWCRRLLFLQEPTIEHERLLSESRHTTSHVVIVEADGVRYAVPCEGREVKYGDAGLAYHVMGWTTLG